MRIGGLTKTSLIDFPGEISAIVFTKGCNFKCGYCHNPELVGPALFGEDYPIDRLFSFLESRKGKLDGVVVTGGEPLLQLDLIPFIRKIKDMGFLVKLDTNGLITDKLSEIVDQGLVDYIAMDVKAPFDKYENIVNKRIPVKDIEKSIKLIMHSGIDYEFRTTVVKDQLRFDDFEKIGTIISGARLWVIQKFIPSKTLDPTFMRAETYTDTEFDKVRSICEQFVQRCIVR